MNIVNRITDYCTETFLEVAKDSVRKYNQEFSLFSNYTDDINYNIKGMSIDDCSNEFDMFERGNCHCEMKVEYRETLLSHKPSLILCIDYKFKEYKVLITVYDEIHGRVRTYEDTLNKVNWYTTFNQRFVMSFNNVVTSDFPYIRKVLIDGPATIVFWSDGTKTVVKCQDTDIYDLEKGLAMAISKKALGNKGNYYETFKKYRPFEERFNWFKYHIKYVGDIVTRHYGLINLSDRKD